MYFVYALYSAIFNKIYVGYSSNPENRLKSHNDSRNSGWTGRFQPWKIIYTEKIETKAEALKREKQLKTARGRKFIWGIVEIELAGSPSMRCFFVSFVTIVVFVK